MTIKPIVTLEILEGVASAFDKALQSNLEAAITGPIKSIYYSKVAASAPKLFRQELGLEARDAYDYRPNPRPKTEAALRKLLGTADENVLDGIEGELGIPNGSGGDVAREAIFHSVRAARDEVTSRLTQAQAARRRPLRSPEEVAAGKADAFAKRVTKAKSVSQ